MLDIIPPKTKFTSDLTSAKVRVTRAIEEESNDACSVYEEQCVDALKSIDMMCRGGAVNMADFTAQ